MVIFIVNVLGDMKSSSKFRDIIYEYLGEKERGVFWNSLSEIRLWNGLGLC